jgi:hypothetical protein
MYGQLLGGKINFAIDLPGGGNGTNFDGWMPSLVLAAITAKNAGGSREEVRKAIEQKLNQVRGVSIEEYLALRQGR